MEKKKRQFYLEIVDWKFEISLEACDIAREGRFIESEKVLAMKEKLTVYLQSVRDNQVG